MGTWILDTPQGCGQKINLHGLAADFAFQLGNAGLGLASGLDPGAAVGAASGAGKGSLDAVALHLCLPVVELFAFYLEFARQGRTRLAGFEPPDGRQLELLCESSSRQSNLLTVPWSIVPSFLVSLFGSIPQSITMTGGKFRLERPLSNQWVLEIVPHVKRPFTVTLTGVRERSGRGGVARGGGREGSKDLTTDKGRPEMNIKMLIIPLTKTEGVAP